MCRACFVPMPLWLWPELGGLHRNRGLDRATLLDQDRIIATVCDVVVLDDEPLIRDLCVQFLADAGFAALGAETAGAALTVLAEHGAKLLVADKLLTGCEDGYALAREAMRRWPGLRVVYTSGHPRGLRDVGPGPRERVLPKPFRASELISVVRELIG